MTVTAKTQLKWRNKLISYHLEKLRTDPLYGVDYVQDSWRTCVAGMFFRDAENLKGLPNGIIEHNAMLTYIGYGCPYIIMFGEDFADEWLCGPSTAIGRFDFIRRIFYMAEEHGFTTYGDAMDAVIGTVNDMERMENVNHGSLHTIADEIAQAEKHLAETRARHSALSSAIQPCQYRLSKMLAF